MNPSHWIDATLAQAAARPDVADCIVIVTDTQQVNLRFAANALTTNGRMHTVAATVIAIADRADGTRAAVSREGTVTDAGGCTALLADAAAELADAAAAPDAMALVDGGQDATFAEGAPTTDATVFADVAPALARAFAAARAEEHLLASFAEHVVTTTWLGTNAGTRRRHVQPAGRLEINAKLPDLVASAWVGAATQDPATLDVAAMHDELRRRLGWSSTRIDLPAGRYETLLPPSAVADLLIEPYWSMSARDAEAGENAFSAPDGGTLIGCRLASLPVSIVSDPHHVGVERAPFVIAPAGRGSEVSVFDNGAPVEAVRWVDAGVLRELQRTRAVAEASGAAFTHPVDNLVVDGGPDATADLDTMIKNTRDGLLVTCLWYIRSVDPRTGLLTGLTRDGVYRIVDGEVVGLVNNFRFNESPISLLGRITEVGKAETTLPREWQDWFDATIAPPVRVPDFHMSTVSAAH